MPRTPALRVVAVTVALAVACLGGLAALALAAGAQPKDPSLLGDWRFDEGTGDAVLDGSGHDNEGEIHGAEWVTGKFGTALHFGGRGAYVTVPGIPGLDGSNEMTVEAWVYWEKGGRYPNIITGGTWCPGGFLIFVADEGCSFRMGKPGNAPLTVGGDWDETSASLGGFTFGRWYHLAATFRRPDIRTYVNGKLVGSATWDYAVGFSGDLQIGTWGNPDVCHTGMIDEVRLYNRALTPEEVLAEYQRTATGREAPSGPGQRAYETIPSQPPVPAATIENDLTRITLDGRAKVIGLVDKASGRDHCGRPFQAFATVTKGGRTYSPSSCAYRHGRLSLAFGRSGITADIQVTIKQRYLVFEVVSVSDPEVDALVFGSLVTDLSKNMSASIAWASDGQFAATATPLNLQVEVGLTGGSQPSLAPRCVKRYGLVGARVALAGCPTPVVRDVLKEVVRAEGLPVSPLGGPFARDAEENRGSYLFATVSEQNVDEWIEMGHRGGFAEIHLCPWWRGLGHYDPNPDLFPHGLDGLKQVTDKLHAAGFRVGLHTLTGCIQVDDAWVSPVPDKRLATDAKFTLAEPVGPDDTVIRTAERPEGLETFWGDMSTGNTVRIGDEIIAYTGLGKELPYGFTGCTRGQWGTHRAAHDKGAAVDHLVASYCSYIPDEDTGLVDELADCIAKVFNTCRADMIYLDGSEGMRTSHAVAKMKQAIFTRLKGRVLVESSSGAWGAWPIQSRVGTWDHPIWGFNRFTDLHCRELETYSANELLPGHMGWWVITGPGPDWAGMFPEDMEYFCGKCLGWDLSMSLEGVTAGTPPNARQDEYLTMLGRYERLRLARYFTEEALGKLRQPGKQFRLAQDDGGTWQLRPTDYAAHKVTSLSDGTAAWTVRNRFGAQPASLRVEALYTCQPYDAAEGILLTDFTRPEDFTDRPAAAGVTHSLVASAEQVKAGAVSGCFTARNTTSDRRGAWAKLGKPFSPPLDMSKCAALGVWVYGDGKGELLNLQLNNNREDYPVWDDHYVDVDFTGWRYFELLLRERDAQRHQDYVWPYGGACEVGRSPVVRGRVGALNLYYNNLPPGEEVRCFIGPVRALPVLKTTVANPTVTIAGKRLTFPVALESGQFIECEGRGDCRLHDERGAVLQRIRPEGELLDLQPGANAASVTGEATGEYNARLNVTVISQGPPLGGLSPREKVDWSLLRAEYDDPRTISIPSIGTDSWDVLCRPDAARARLEAELVVESAGKPGAAYEAPGALTLEPFDDLARFAAGPDNRFARYVYDGEDNGVADKPGVTATLEPVTGMARVGASCARFTATSKRGDSAGWCARGERFDPPLDLSDRTAIGLWVHGDGLGESLKLQLRDVAGAWYDMVTRVDFTGWRYAEFELGAEGSLNLRHIEYLILFYNGLPTGRTVTCHVDDIRALRTGEFVRRPALTVGGRRLTFPLALAPGERLVYRGHHDCVVYARDGAVRQVVEPQGAVPELRPGHNPVRFEADPGSAAEYRVRVRLTKVYAGGK